MGQTSIDRLTDEASLLGESPTWDQSEGVLWWVDIDGRRINRYSMSSRTSDSRNTPGRPGSVALTSDSGRLLLAMEGEVGFFEWETGEWKPEIELDSPEPGNRLNDGRCDPSGRFWVGSMYADVEARRATGLLYRLDSLDSATTVRTGIGISNGLAFAADGTVMFFADTFDRTVWKYALDLRTGSVGHRSVFSDFSDLAGNPDGACVDEDGCYWVAAAYGGTLVRFAPTGVVDRVVKLPVLVPTMPAFGGPGLDTLFVTSIDSGEEGDDQGGHVLVLDVGVRGLPEPEFEPVAVSS